VICSGPLSSKIRHRHQAEEVALAVAERLTQGSAKRTKDEGLAQGSTNFMHISTCFSMGRRLLAHEPPHLSTLLPRFPTALLCATGMDQCWSSVSANQSARGLVTDQLHCVPLLLECARAVSRGVMRQHQTNSRNEIVNANCI